MGIMRPSVILAFLAKCILVANLSPFAPWSLGSSFQGLNYADVRQSYCEQVILRHAAATDIQDDLQNRENLIRAQNFLFSILPLPEFIDDPNELARMIGNDAAEVISKLINWLKKKKDPASSDTPYPLVPSIRFYTDNFPETLPVLESAKNQQNADKKNVLATDQIWQNFLLTYASFLNTQSLLSEIRSEPYAATVTASGLVITKYYGILSLLDFLDRYFKTDISRSYGRDIALGSLRLIFAYSLVYIPHSAEKHNNELLNRIVTLAGNLNSIYFNDSMITEVANSIRAFFNDPEISSLNLLNGIQIIDFQRVLTSAIAFYTENDPRFSPKPHNH